MYVQHESERVCVCQRACVCMCVFVCVQIACVSLSYSDTTMVLQAGGMNTGSIPGSFASPSRLQDNLCLWVEK